MCRVCFERIDFNQRLDETGIGEFFNLLNNITGLKMLITHNTDLKTRFGNIITVRKQDGISTVVQT